MKTNGTPSLRSKAGAGSSVTPACLIFSRLTFNATTSCAWFSCDAAVGATLNGSSFHVKITLGGRRKRGGNWPILSSSRSWVSHTPVQRQTASLARSLRWSCVTIYGVEIAGLAYTSPLVRALETGTSKPSRTLKQQRQNLSVELIAVQNNKRMPKKTELKFCFVPYKLRSAIPKNIQKNNRNSVVGKERQIPLCLRISLKK